MGDGLEHISKDTRKRAKTLITSARKVPLDIGKCRFPDEHDYIVHFFTNGAEYMMVYTTPDCYLAEHWYNEEGDEENLLRDFFCIKNIRNFLYALKREDYTSCDSYYSDLSEEEDENSGQE